MHEFRNDSLFYYAWSFSGADSGYRLTSISFAGSKSN